MPPGGHFLEPNPPTRRKHHQASSIGGTFSISLHLIPSAKPCRSTRYFLGTATFPGGAQFSQRRKGMLRKNFIALVVVAAMLRFLLLTGVILPVADYSFAQDYSPDPTPIQCHLIKQAVAQYGSAAARRHALETCCPEAVKTGDKCFTNREGRGTSSCVPTQRSAVEGGAGVK